MQASQEVFLIVHLVSLYWNRILAFFQDMADFRASLSIQPNFA